MLDRLLHRATVVGIDGPSYRLRAHQQTSDLLRTAAGHEEAAMPAELQDWRAERSCPICWTGFTPASRRHRYCSDRCRKSAHLRRQNKEGSSDPDIGRPQPTPAAVAVRVCPHCGHEVSIVALLTTPAAARPTVPEPGVIPLRRA